MIDCSSLLTCAAVGSPEDQAGKWFTRHESAQVNCTSIHSSLWAPGSMRMMPCSLHAGHHSSWHRREDLHAISNVRYDLRWRSLLKLLKFLHFVFLFFTLKIISSLRRLCTIWNTDCKSHVKIIHCNHAFHRTELGCAEIHLHARVWG